jgi:hypothetical protein
MRLTRDGTSSSKPFDYLVLLLRSSANLGSGVSGGRFGLTLRRHGSSGDFVVHLCGHAGNVMLPEDCHKKPFDGDSDAETWA